jgi:transcriptional regulator with XRE-family HTH domain
MTDFFKNPGYDAGMAGRPSSKTPTESGARLAALRKAAGLSQAELAKALDIPQRTVSFYEREADAIPSTLVPPLAAVLGVGVGEILGVPDEGRGKRGPKSKLERQFEQVGRLPKSKQKFVSDFLDTVLKSNA